MGGVKGDGRGDDEVVFNNFDDPHPPTHQIFLDLTAAVKVIIGSGASIVTPDGQPHWPVFLRCSIIITAPTPSPPLLHPKTPQTYHLHYL